MDTAFDAAKEALAAATMLNYHRSEARTTLTTDASATSVGAVLEQLVNGVWQHAFFSRQLRPPEQKYSAFHREL